MTPRSQLENTPNISSIKPPVAAW